MMTAPITEDARTALEQAASRMAGLRLLVLFGSVARGRALATSDADIGMLGGAFWDQLTLGSAVGRILGREAHVVDLATASELLRYEVARDGLPIFQADPDVWPRFQAEAVVRYIDFQPILAICADGARRRLLREAHRG
jgi:predicted nucleotidyltransferase